jgi:hypothetical protein
VSTTSWFVEIVTVSGDATGEIARCTRDSKSQTTSGYAGLYTMHICTVVNHDPLNPIPTSKKGRPWA